MSFLERLFFPSKDWAKIKKFRAIEKDYAYDPAEVQFLKSVWLASRGSWFSKQDKVNEAVRDYREAIQLDSRFIGSFIGLATLYFGAGEFQSALTVLTSAPKTMKGESSEVSSDLDVLSVMAIVYGHMGRQQEAMECASRALAAAADPVRVEYDRGFLASGVSPGSKGDQGKVDQMHELIAALSSPDG